MANSPPDQPQTLDPRALLSDRFPQGQPPLLQAPARASEVLGSAAALQSWFLRLLLPRLDGAGRLRLRDAAQQGLPQLLRAYEQISRSAAFRRSIRVSGLDLPTLRRLHGQLARIAALAERLQKGGEAGERWAEERLSSALDRLEETAEALSLDSATPAPQRRAAAAFVTSLRAERARQADNDEQQARKASRLLRRAEAEAAERLAPLQEVALRRDLLDGDADPRAGAPGAARVLPQPGAGKLTARRRAAAPEQALDTPAGAPLDRCLSAPPGDYAACVADLDARCEALRFPAGEGARGDALADCDLALLLAPVLAGLPWLEEAAEHGAADLEELCDLRAACGGLARAARVLFQGARDGLLCAGAMALEVHGRAQAALRGLPASPEAAELRVLIDGAQARLDEGKARKAAPLQAADGKVAALSADTEERLEEATFDRTMADLRAGEEVPVAELARAAAFKRGRRGTSARPGAGAPATPTPRGTTRPGRRRPR